MGYSNSLKEHNIENQCYICTKKAKEEYHNSEFHSYVNNIYKIKKGFFSTEYIIICIPCKESLKDLFGKRITPTDNMFSLSKEAVSYIIDNKEKIIKEKDKAEEKEKKKRRKEEKERIAGRRILGKKNEEKRKKEEKEENKRIDSLKIKITGLLKEKAIKIPASDIDAHLKHKKVDEIKKLCEEMYMNGEISRTGNYRYFVLVEKKKPKKTSAPKSEKVDVEKELEKLKGLLDKGLIKQEAYDAKMNQLLGL